MSILKGGLLIYKTRYRDKVVFVKVPVCAYEINDRTMEFKSLCELSPIAFICALISTFRFSSYSMFSRPFYVIVQKYERLKLIGGLDDMEINDVDGKLVAMCKHMPFFFI